MKRRTKKDKKDARRSSAITALIVVLAVAIVFAVIQSSANRQPTASVNGSATAGQASASGIPYLNTTDIILTTNSTQYAPVYINRLTVFSPNLMKLGYLSSSSSLFNFTGKINNFTTFPATIGVIVFLMNNGTSAAESVNSMIFSNNANQSIRGYVLNSTALSRYSYNGKGIYIYTIGSIAVFNRSVIGSPNMMLPMPDYQYTSIFSYNNAVATVVVNGYTSSLNNTVSRRLAQALAEKMVAANCCNNT